MSDASAMDVQHFVRAISADSRTLSADVELGFNDLNKIMSTCQLLCFNPQLSPNGIPICDGCSLQQFHNPTLAGRGLSVDFCSILGRASRLIQI